MLLLTVLPIKASGKPNDAYKPPRCARSISSSFAERSLKISVLINSLSETPSACAIFCSC